MRAEKYIVGTAGRFGVLIAAYMGNIPLMFVFTSIAALGMSPLQGDMNALIATTSEYTRLTTGKRVDGTMYSCTSFGTKVGGGIGTAIARMASGSQWLRGKCCYTVRVLHEYASCNVSVASYDLQSELHSFFSD